MIPPGVHLWHLILTCERVKRLLKFIMKEEALQGCVNLLICLITHECWRFTSFHLQKGNKWRIEYTIRFPFKKQAVFYIHRGISTSYERSGGKAQCFIAGICIWGLVRLQLGSIWASRITANCVSEFLINCRLSALGQIVNIIMTWHD